MPRLNGLVCGVLACLLGLASCTAIQHEPGVREPDRTSPPSSQATPTPQSPDPVDNPSESSKLPTSPAAEIPETDRSEPHEAGTGQPTDIEETRTSDQAVPEEPARHYIDDMQRQFVLIGDWTPPADADIVCEDAFIVTAESGVLRAGPGTEYPRLTSVPRLTPLPVQETRGSWHRVAMAGIGVVEDHWIAGDQGRAGGWCIHLKLPES